MKVYIAGPMTGYRDFNRPAFRQAAEELAAAGHEVLSPVHDDDLAPDGSPLHEWGWYMRRDIALLLEADALAYLDGSQDSTGASLEIHIARTLEMIVLPIRGFLP